MYISEIKKRALSRLEGNWGQAVLLTFILFLLNTALLTSVEIFFSGGLKVWLEQDVVPMNANLINLVLSILLIPFTTGVMWYYLDLMRGDVVTIGSAFSIYSKIDNALKMIGAAILQGIYLFFWSLLLIIPGIIKSFSYSQTFYLLKDHPEYGIDEAITESRRRMDGLKLDYFILHLSFIGWYLLGLITFGIGFLWIYPYVSASLAIFYNERIADKKEPEVEATPITD